MDFLAALDHRPTGIKLQALSRPLVDEISARYDFIEPFEGGLHSGTVWKVFDRHLNAFVAVRLFRPRNHACSPKAAVHLQQRLHPTIHLDHPNIVKTHEVRELGDNAYLVSMSLVRGPTLSRFVHDERRFTYPQVLDILTQIASALQAGHAIGLSRQHLSPGNIVFPFPLKPVLVDWGLSIRQDVSVSQHCLPPEFSVESDERSDIYLLGVIAYLLVTGRSPFAACTMLDVLREQLRDRRLNVSQSMPGFPGTFDRFLARTVRRNPDDRYPSMLEAISALMQLRKDEDDEVKGQRICSKSLCLAGLASLGNKLMIAS